MPPIRRPRRSPAAPTRKSRSRRSTSTPCVVKFQEPTPFWADAFVAAAGCIIPKHLFEDYIGAKSREAPTNLKPVGTGPYKFKDFKPGDLVAGVINPDYHEPNRPHFDAHRDEGRRRCGLGGARGAADRRVRLRAGTCRSRTRSSSAWRRAARAASSSSRRRHRAHPAQLHRSVDRGRRRALEPQDHASDPVAIRRCARRSRCWSTATRSRSTSTAAAAWRRRTTSTTPSASASKTTKYEFNVDKANAILDKAGWTKGADGIRAKDGKKLKFVFQTSINQPRQKTQAIIKQACQKAGIEVELKSVTASVFFSSDVANPDTYPKFYSDLQMYNTGMAQPDPEVFLRRFCSWEASTKDNKWQGRNTTRWQNKEFDDIHKAGQVELDPVKRAAMMIKLNELVVNDHVVIPLVARLGVAAVEQQARGRAQRLGQQHGRSGELVPGKLTSRSSPLAERHGGKPQSRDPTISDAAISEIARWPAPSLPSPDDGMTRPSAVDGGGRACSHPALHASCRIAGASGTERLRHRDGRHPWTNVTCVVCWTR